MKYILFFLFLITSGLCSAQSLLWEISGKGLSSPSYLYGTIHIQDPTVFKFDNIVMNKLHDCDAYAMELVLDEISPEEMKASTIMKKESLDKLLSKEEFNELNSFFRKKTGTGILLYNKMKPFFIMSQLMQEGMNKEMPEALDLYFLKEARKEKKKIYGIEKLSDQIKAIDQISLKDQARMLMDAIRDTTAQEAQYTDLLNAYKKADLEQMLKLSNDTSMPKNFNEAFLIGRNKNMANNIIKYSKQGKTFNAIGAAHLGGEKGVINLLRKKGYKVEPVLFKFTN